MNVHDQFSELLARRSELSFSEELRLQAHLSDCFECRRLADDYAHQTNLLRSLPMADPPIALRAAVVNRISELPPRRRFAFRLPVFVPLAAAAVIAVVATIAVLIPKHHADHTALQVNATSLIATVIPRSTGVPSATLLPATPRPRPVQPRPLAPQHPQPRVRPGFVGHPVSPPTGQVQVAPAVPAPLAPQPPIVVSQRLATPVPPQLNVGSTPRLLVPVQRSSQPLPARRTSAPSPVTAFRPTVAPSRVVAAAPATVAPSRVVAVAQPIPPSAPVVPPSGTSDRPPPGAVVVSPPDVRSLHPPDIQPTPPPVPQPTLPSPPPPNPEPLPSAPTGAMSVQAPQPPVPTPIP